jgi:UrcA family protein
MRKTLILVSCVLVAFTVEGQARENYKHRTVAVDYADLDLSNQADLQTLRQRVNHAAKKACSSPHDNGMVIGTNSDRRRCIIWTREQALAAISNTTQLASRPTAIRADRQFAEVSIPSTVAKKNHEQRVVRLSWRNKDLRQDNNLRQLRDRIDQSAEKVCESPADQGAGVTASRDKQRCMDEARDAAYASIPNGQARFAALDQKPASTLQAEPRESLWDWFVTILK